MVVSGEYHAPAALLPGKPRYPSSSSLKNKNEIANVGHRLRNSLHTNGAYAM
jgi:hypothetical protein